MEYFCDIHDEINAWPTSTVLASSRYISGADACFTFNLTNFPILTFY